MNLLILVAFLAHLFHSTFPPQSIQVCISNRALDTINPSPLTSCSSFTLMCAQKLQPISAHVRMPVGQRDVQSLRLQTLDPLLRNFNLSWLVESLLLLAPTENEQQQQQVSVVNPHVRVVPATSSAVGSEGVAELHARSLGRAVLLARIEHPSLSHQFVPRRPSTSSLLLDADRVRVAKSTSAKTSDSSPYEEAETESHLVSLIGDGSGATVEGLLARVLVTVELQDFVITPARRIELLPCEPITLSLVSQLGDSAVDASFEQVWR